MYLVYTHCFVSITEEIGWISILLWMILSMQTIVRKESMSDELY